MLSDNPEIFRGLTYPWTRSVDPKPGQPEEVAPGVYWARFPMPMSLDHINIWLLEDGDGWTVVDTCLAMDDSRRIWEQLFSGFMQGKPITRVICTHMHPDHVGLAGWLVERFGCELWMTREEFLMCRAMVSDTGQDVPEVAINFYHAAGYTEEQLQNYREKFGSFGKAISPLPSSFRRIVDRETLTIGNRYWQVIVGSGHSPEHACLYCPALKILISGDQVLPKITPNVSVFPTEPHGDPLSEWLSSCTRIRAILPDDLLVLPAHEAPFYGLHTRLTQIIESHQHDLAALYKFLDQPRRAVDCFPALFTRKLEGHNLGLATGETLAHLNCLKGRRQVTSSQDEQGVNWYLRLPDSAAFVD
ncbi:MBL fold metallo-hydrolase [Parahaliea sp. F7430]|uniref:MBL fold metallo-hydrolase n=1 Tax=Sediminihaliea albiluteola TaxID=2758564 RepID=A0A7W2TWZ6_9GAMM|nr:MBL fold metallo-hydrolase [Sediminihaliea albiluteola]MBA6413456.1 MBL fold metallo-hydrolase [Sediminihaliea albiluteola]